VSDGALSSFLRENIWQPVRTSRTHFQCPFPVIPRLHWSGAIPPAVPRHSHFLVRDGGIKLGADQGGHQRHGIISAFIAGKYGAPGRAGPCGVSLTPALLRHLPVRENPPPARPPVFPRFRRHFCSPAAPAARMGQNAHFARFPDTPLFTLCCFLALHRLDGNGVGCTARRPQEKS